MLRKGGASAKRRELVARSRHVVGATFIAALVLCAANVALPVLGRTPNANASGSGLPTCSTSVLREAVSTSQRSYGPGTLVVMTSSVRNVSDKNCSVGVGPTSPSFTITNSKGVVVWNNCYANDRPGACALHFVAHTLKPGTTFATTVKWNQQTGQPPTRASTGAYRLTARFSGISGHRTTCLL